MGFLHRTRETTTSTISKIGTPNNKIVANQEDSGLWRTGYEQAKHTEPTDREKEAMLWVGLAICRVFGGIARRQNVEITAPVDNRADLVVKSSGDEILS